MDNKEADADEVKESLTNQTLVMIDQGKRSPASRLKRTYSNTSNKQWVFTFAQNDREEYELIKVSQMAKILGICEATAYRLIEAGEFPVVHVLKTIRIPRSAIYDWISKQITK